MKLPLVKLSMTLCVVAFGLPLFGITRIACVRADAPNTTSADAAKGDTAKEEQPDAGKGASKAEVKAWFAKYDQVRRDAEMSTTEKLQAHSLMAKGLDLISEKHKEKSKKFASIMSDRYAKAAEQIKQLDANPVTDKLQKGYAQFFSQAQAIFSDIAAEDKSTDKDAIKVKKEQLSALDKKNKDLDKQLRDKFGVAPHRHK